MGFLILGIHSRFLYDNSGDPLSFGGAITEGLVGAARRVTVSKNRAGHPMDTRIYLPNFINQQLWGMFFRFLFGIGK